MYGGCAVAGNCGNLHIVSEMSDLEHNSARHNDAPSVSRSHHKES